MKYSNFPTFIRKLSNRGKLYRCFLSINYTVQKINNKNFTSD